MGRGLLRARLRRGVGLCWPRLVGPVAVSSWVRGRYFVDLRVIKLRAAGLYFERTDERCGVFGGARGGSVSTGHNMSRYVRPARRSRWGSVHGAQLIRPTRPGWLWRGVDGSCQFRVCSCVLGRCTRSVGNAPFLFGCSAPYRVQRPLSGAAPPCLWWLSGLWGSSGLELSSAWGLCGASCCGSSEMSHVIPRHVFQTLKSHRWNCNVLGRCTKFGYPNYVRVLVDEAPKANSCVRSSSHDTAHDPRDASNTTPTPHNAKSR